MGRLAGLGGRLAGKPSDGVFSRARSDGAGVSLFCSAGASCEPWEAAGNPWARSSSFFFGGREELASLSFRNRSNSSCQPGSTMVDSSSAGAGRDVFAGVEAAGRAGTGEEFFAIPDFPPPACVSCVVRRPGRLGRREDI